MWGNKALVSVVGDIASAVDKNVTAILDLQRRVRALEEITSTGPPERPKPDRLVRRHRGT